MRNSQKSGGFADKPPSAPLSPSSVAAQLLLRATFPVTGADDRPLTPADLLPGITIIECPREHWVWPLAIALSAKIDTGGANVAINAQPSSFAQIPLAIFPGARDDDDVGAGEDAEAIDESPLVTILVHGGHEGRPDHVQFGTGRRIEIDDTEQCLASLASLMTSGSRTLIFVHDAEELAPLVRAGSDRLLKAPPLDEGTFRTMLKTVFDGSAAVAVPALAEVDPVLLDLAYRSNDSAGTYVERLKRLMGARGAAIIAPPRRATTDVPGFPKRLEDVHGMDEAAAWARQVVTDLVDYRMGCIDWDDVDRGALLAGPSGTGKTKLAGLIAAEAGVPLIAGSAARWQRGDGGNEVQRSMAEAFERAQKASPAILLIDELDSFRTRQARSDHNSSYYTNLVNGLLELLDGPTPREGVVVIGTTNNPDWVDPAVLRPGRLERVIEVPTPNYDALRSIIDFYTGQRFTDGELDDAARLAIARQATGANVESWARAMRRRARHERREPAFADLVYAIDR